MEFSLNLPINSVSFGQVSVAILREIKSRGLAPALIPIGQIDLSTHIQDSSFDNWLKACLDKGLSPISRDQPLIKLWHLNGSENTMSDNQILISFYELDSPTSTELNVVSKNKKVLFTSEYTCSVFRNSGAKNIGYIPLGFDSYNFKKRKREYFRDGRITFNIVGKFEKRKHHAKILSSWAKRFGDNAKYSLQCSIYNHFLRPDHNIALVTDALMGKRYFNINFWGFIPHNELYNDFLNSGDIVIGMSGGEGWGLPEFQSVALGKHAVILDCNGYRSWSNSENSVLVNTNGKIPAYDGIFFQPNSPFNQGNIFDFNEEEFINACENAIKKAEERRENEAGTKLQKDFTYSKVVDALLEEVKSCHTAP
jgi:glycosyltransferase involved in cell wall biosynthesis